MGKNARRRGYEQVNTRVSLREKDDWGVRRTTQPGQFRQAPPPAPAQEERFDARKETASSEAEFVLDMPTAKAVNVAGTFNNWNPNQHSLQKNENGLWQITVRVPAGRHEYRFIVDGQWMSDPKAVQSVANPHGSSNSVLIV